MDPSKRMPAKKRKRIFDILFTPVVLVLANVYMEIVFHIGVFGNIRIIYPILLSIPTALVAAVVCDLFKEKVCRVLRFVFLGAAWLIFCTQVVYHQIFAIMMTWNMVGMAGQVAANPAFVKAAFIGIWQSLPLIILLALPIVAQILLIKWLNPQNKPYLLKSGMVAVLFAAFEILALIALPIGGTSAHSAFDVYHSNWDLDLGAERLGMTCATLKDWKECLFPGETIPIGPVVVDVPTDETDKRPDDTTVGGDTSDEGSTTDEPPVPVNPLNTIEGLDFAALAKKEKNEEIKALYEYLAELAPTKKNEYTGMFEGYNLIMICAESFSPVAVNPDVTPTLYRLANSGFVFKNYWSTMQSETTNGEYCFMTGLVPDFSKPKKDGSFLYLAKNGSTMNLTISSWFKASGLQPRAYHPNTVTYYSRNLTHPLLGYVLKGQEDYNLKGWPESDLELVQKSIGEYINDDRFITYIMSVSGHHNYKFGGYNYIADKNKSAVIDLDLSKYGMYFDLTNETHVERESYAKAYLACNMELDKALEYLISELEKAGKLDKTVICLTADHYPYGLTDQEYAQMLGYKKASSMKYDRLERYKSTLILWNSKMGTIEIDKPCCSVDILPTLLNLFGCEYDSRLYSGQDILSSSYGLAITKNQSFITDKIAYNSLYQKVYKLDKSWTMPDGYLDAYIQIVKNRFAIADNILNYDFYEKLPQNVISEAQKKFK